MSEMQRPDALGKVLGLLPDFLRMEMLQLWRPYRLHHMHESQGRCSGKSLNRSDGF